MRLRFGRLIIIGVVLGLAIGDYLHITNKLKSDRDYRVAVSTPLPATSSTPTPSPTSTPLVAGQASIKISTYHIKIVASDPITDLAYGEEQYNGATEVGFTTESLLAKYPACKPGALGYLLRTKVHTTATPNSTPQPSASSSYFYTPHTTLYNQKFSKTVDGYAYTYVNPSSNCASDSEGQNAVTQAKAALIGDALPTIATYNTQP
ncbi:MAG TPA: hypothetical protein VGH44_00940 [Candidatus Saccharimonadia bacterium]